MSSLIEEELRKRCADNPNVRLLLAQWEYDRLLVTQALATVGHAFPHYSLHDATHSETILERIASMLGSDGIARLSATDLWLLMEAAYLHDSGMVVLDVNKRNDLASPEFESHIKAVIHGSDHELAARAVRLQDGNLGGTPLDILEGHLDLLLVYAEFVRQRHPQRAEHVALAPFEHARVNSPRTTLLPNRLWYMIGRICRAHGESRDFVFQELPLEESGISGEICHPRFVACMLRLGDLLDLDSGRFCPTVNATISPMPTLSAAHRDKHAGVRRLLVCPSRIEVSGVYTDLNAYLEAERWFAWLREELSAQLTRWDEIAPPEFVSLPSAGRIEARLEGQITLEVSARPRFEVDREKTLELVQGANIYTGPEDAVREILQNAVDATLLRFSYDAQSNGKQRPNDLDDLRQQLREYPISVRLEKDDQSCKDPDKIDWTLTVRDRGIGIREEDAKFMLRLGSSKRNPYRRELKAWLPDWARPSGTFGIGFHSLFLYCHDVRVVSRHPDDPDGLEFAFTTQTDATEPTVIIRKQRRIAGAITFPPPTGTTITATFRVDRMARDSYDIGSYNRPFAGIRVIEEHDFVLDDEIPRAAAAISDLLGDMVRNGLCPIELELPHAPAASPGTRSDDDGHLLRHFSSDEGMEVRINKCHFGSTRMETRYRGSPVSGWFIDAPPFIGQCDLHASDADAFLEISRNDFTREGIQAASQRLRSVLKSVVPGWMAQLRDSAHQQDRDTLRFVSLYAFLNDIEPHGEEWKAVQFMSDAAKSQSLDLGAIADADAATWGQRDHHYHARRQKNVVLLRGPTFESSDHWLAILLRKFFPSRRLESIENGRHRQYTLTKGTEGEDVSEAALVQLLIPHFFAGRRGVLPCPRRFEGLAQDSDPQMWQPGRDPLVLAKIANPFVCTSRWDRGIGSVFSVQIPLVRRYVQWLSKQRSESESVIAEQLLEFIKYVDELMNNHWSSCKRYDLQAVETELLALKSST